MRAARSTDGVKTNTLDVTPNVVYESGGSLFGSFKIFQLLFFSLALALLAACVKDESNAVGPNESLTAASSGASLKLSLVNASDGTATTSITPNEPALITALVLDRNSEPAVSQVVEFSADLGQLDSADGKALTSSAGQAQIRLVAAGTGGVGQVTATVTLLTGETLQGTLNYTIEGIDGTSNNNNTDSDQPNAVINLTLTSEDRNDNTIRVDAPGTLTLTVTDGVNPMANQVVSVVAAASTLNPTNGLVLTNSEGVATVRLTPTGTTGADIITATLTIGEDSFTSTLGYAIAAPIIKLGSGSGESFTDQSLSLGLSSVSAGGTTLVTATIVDENNALVTTGYDINFTSACAENNLATIDGAVATSNGSATATYRANGCVGTDTITATLLVGTTQFTATADFTVLSDTAGSLKYVSVSPNIIGLQGAGGLGLSESATVTFQLLGEQGLPLANQQINFSLTTNVGGITLRTSSAITDAAGQASAIVQSGSIATSVGVIATLNGTGLSSQSEQLNITTGVPDQDSMTLAFSIQNPEAWNYFGEQITATAYLADMFNNPVPDGTAVSFTAEGGQIQGACTTSGGSCSVIWQSQNPRPDVDNGEYGTGRVTILASAIGAESFYDDDGNGVFSDGDEVMDLSEAFRDDNEDDQRNEVSVDGAPAEPYIDFNVNGEFDEGDELYSGPLCEHSTDCANQNKLTIWESGVIVMSTSALDIDFSLDPTMDVTVNNSVVVTIADQHGNAPPYGTIISVSATNGELETEGEIIVDSRTEPLNFAVRVLPDGTPDTGSLLITAETPKGIITSGAISIVD